MKSLNDVQFPLRLDRATCEVSGVFEFSKEAELYREQTWTDFVAAHPQAFDGPLTRLRKVTACRDQLVFDCERTSYSAYVASRKPAFLERFPGSGRADPIGMTVITLSYDRYILVSRRSFDADQNPGGLYFVGGYLEPPRGDGQVDLAEEAARELREETGITMVDTADSWLLGVGYDKVFCHPEVTILLKIPLCRDGMLEFVPNAIDAHESSSFQTIHIDALLCNGISESPIATMTTTWGFEHGRSLLHKVADSICG
jgi:8-oxo-dGTP pyrophosphatase MutT (NUDIX family)